MEEIPMGSRMLAAALMILTIAVYFYWVEVQVSERGREAFLAHQAQRWDWDYAQPSFLSFSLRPSIFAVGGVLAAYEAVAWLISMIMNKIAPARPARGDLSAHAGEGGGM
jgi:hypothetical protein